MEDINVGDYVRTKSGEIGKVDSLCGMIENTIHLENKKWFDIRDIVKHSKNIIDLVEVEDIIKLKISEIYMKIVIADDRILANLREKLEKYNTEDFGIIEVLTHEQYEKNMYKVVE